MQVDGWGGGKRRGSKERKIGRRDAHWLSIRRRVTRPKTVLFRQGGFYVRPNSPLRADVITRRRVYERGSGMRTALSNAFPRWGEGRVPRKGEVFHVSLDSTIPLRNRNYSERLPIIPRVAFLNLRSTLEASNSEAAFGIERDDCSRGIRKGATQRRIYVM